MKVTICDKCGKEAVEPVYISLTVGPDRLSFDLCKGCVNVEGIRALWTNLERICGH